MKTRCSCPDSSNPCKHIAAVYYLLGEEFDRDPFLIFALRGMSREALMARLEASAAREADDIGSTSAGAEAGPRQPLAAGPAPVPIFRRHDITTVAFALAGGQSS